MNQQDKTDSETFEDPLSDFEPREYPSELHRVLDEESSLSIKTNPCTTIESETTIEAAVAKLAELDVSSLLVVKDEKLVGIFTERDVLEKVAVKYDSMLHLPVSEVMTSDPSVIYESDPVGAAVGAIAVAGHRHVPVLDMDGKVVGIVSPKRVLSYLDPMI